MAEKMQPEDFRGLTPLFYGHVNPYGRLILNMNERIMIVKCCLVTATLVLPQIARNSATCLCPAWHKMSF